MTQIIALAADHAGYALKTLLMDEVARLGYQPLDLGPSSEARTDYPLYAAKVTAAMAEGRAQLGLLVCGSGIGMCMAANRAKGIRAFVGHTPAEAALARAHNNANVLCLGARQVSLAEARAILAAFVAGSFEGGRHAQRVALLG